MGEGESSNPKPDASTLFSDVKFIVAQCNKPEEVKNLLIERGARLINYLSEHVSHVISDYNCPEAEEAVELFDKPVVNSLWIHMCLKVDKILPTEAFSPLRSIFRRVVASFSPDISKNDLEILAATLTFYGARLSKDISQSTHLIAPNADSISSDLSDGRAVSVVAPDWVLESVRQRHCCDEQLFGPKLLLPPPPPPPPTPTPPPAPVVQSEPIKPDENKLDINVPKPTQTNKKSELIDQAPASQLQSQANHSPQQHDILPPSQLVRPKAPPNLRVSQPKFRPILPPNNVPIIQRPSLQQTRMITQDSQQPKKVIVNYGQYRKINTNEIPIDSQNVPPMTPQHQHHAHEQQHQHITIQQGVVIQSDRIQPQSNVYQPIRTNYHDGHMNSPRGHPQQPMIVNQSNQMMNRFQDPNVQANQSQYQYPMQSQPSPAYQNTMHRQPVYYSQNHNQVPMRMPQQSPPIRPIQSDQVPYDQYHTSQTQKQQMIRTHNYQTHPPQQAYHQPGNQQMHPAQPQTMPQHALMRPTMKQNFNPTMLPHLDNRPVQRHPSNQLDYQNSPLGPTSTHGHQNTQVKSSKLVNQNQAPQKQPHQTQVQVQVVPSVPTIPSTSTQQQSQPQPQPQQQVHLQPQPQTQPHPSIFDHIQESSLAQIKSKVPNVHEKIDYVGHHPKDEVPEDQVLAGCKFAISESDYTDLPLKNELIDAIKIAGGIIENDLQKSTHLICETRFSEHFSEAIRNSVRCVTITWVKDVLMKNTLSFPWRALHLPLRFTKNEKPLCNQIIAITNFSGSDRFYVKEMVRQSGARYTDHFSSSNTLLICGRAGGEKYERAIEWRIPIVNCSLLTDFLLNENSNFHAMLIKAKYQLLKLNNPLDINTYSHVRDIMMPWLIPISISSDEELALCRVSNGDNSPKPLLNSNDDSGIATSGSNNSDGELTSGKTNSVDCLVDSNLHMNDNKEKEGLKSNNTDLEVKKECIGIDDVKSQVIEDKFSCNSANNASQHKESSNYGPLAMVQDMIEEKPLIKKVESIDSICIQRRSVEPVRLLFSHIDATLGEQLKLYASRLGLDFADGPNRCTHLIMDRIVRTPKLICAINHAKHILSYRWIIESYESNQLLEEEPYILQDKDGEKEYCFDLVHSLVKRKNRPGLLFNNYVFFVTPSVTPKASTLKEMIESAGGVVATRKRPTKLQIKQMKLDGKHFVVVTCETDYHLCSTLETYGVNIVGPEFVISGILRQDIDYETHRLSTIGNMLPRRTRSPIQVPGPSPAKRIRQ